MTSDSDERSSKNTTKITEKHIQLFYHFKNTNNFDVCKDDTRENNKEEEALNLLLKPTTIK